MRNTTLGVERRKPVVSSLCRGWMALVAGVWWIAQPAAAAPWRLVLSESALTFTASYQGEPVPGRFRDFTVQLDFDPATPERGELLVDVDLTSLDTGSRELDELLPEPPWLDVARRPAARFVSRAFRRVAPRRFEVRGDLTLKDVTRPLTLDFYWQPGRAGAIMRGAALVDRRAHSVGTGEWAEDPEVGFRVSVEFALHLEVEP